MKKEKLSESGRVRMALVSLVLALLVSVVGPLLPVDVPEETWAQVAEWIVLTFLGLIGARTFRNTALKE